MTDFSFGLCMWDIPALAILIMVIVVFTVRHKEHKRRQKELEDEQNRTLKETDIA